MDKTWFTAKSSQSSVCSFTRVMEPIHLLNFSTCKSTDTVRPTLLQLASPMSSMAKIANIIALQSQLWLEAVPEGLNSLVFMGKGHWAGRLFCPAHKKNKWHVVQAKGQSKNLSVTATTKNRFAISIRGRTPMISVIKHGFSRSLINATSAKAN